MAKNWFFSSKKTVLMNQILACLENVCFTVSSKILFSICFEKADGISAWLCNKSSQGGTSINNIVLVLFHLNPTLVNNQKILHAE